MKYIVFFTANFDGKTSVGNIGFTGDINNMDDICKVQQDILKHLRQENELKYCPITIAITGWKEFPELKKKVKRSLIRKGKKLRHRYPDWF